MKLAPAFAAILVLGTALSGCSSDEDSNDEVVQSNGESSDESQESVVSPIFYDVSVLQDQTIEISLASPLIVHVENPEHWQEGSTSDANIVQYEPGFVDGDASFNPAFYGLRTGTVEASMQNSDSGETVTFTLVVNHELTGNIPGPSGVDPDAETDVVGELQEENNAENNEEDANNEE